jgi:DNA-directed RNA polymerase specialized sigma24 family protein
MKTLAQHTDLLSRPYLPTEDDKTISIKTRIDKHGDLLTRILYGLGLGKTESGRILEEVCLQAQKQYADYSGIVPFRVWLAKILVRKCIFKLSEDFFKCQTNEQVPAFGTYTIAKSIFEVRQEGMPLSLLVVYQLHHHFGFSDNDIAEILNTNPMNIKERLTKVLSYFQAT